MGGKSFFILFFICYAVLCVFMINLTGSWLYAMLVWNTFLAAIPYWLVYRACKDGMSGKLKLFMLMIALFFWPNSIYLVTDFIHIGGDIFYTFEPYSPAIYVQDIAIWLKLLTIAIGMFFGVALSLAALKRFVEHMKFTAVVKYVCVVALSFVGSIGVYIGRFIRLNSWDMINPVRVVRLLLEHINIFGVEYILAFTVFTAALYAIFEHIVKFDRQ